jgi:hypothetical protein
MNLQGNGVQEKIMKLRAILMANMIDTKRFARIFRSSKEISEFVSSIQKSLKILSISVGEIINIFIEDDKNEFCKLIRSIYDIAELQLTIASQNLLETNQQLSFSKNRRSTLNQTENQALLESTTLVNSKLINSKFKQSNTHNEENDPRNEKESHEKGHNSAQIDSSRMSGKLFLLQKSICKCDCHSFSQHLNELALKYPRTDYIFEEITEKAKVEGIKKEDQELIYMIEESLENEAEKVLNDYERGRIQKFNHVKNPLVLIRINEKLAKKVQDSQYVTKTIYDDFLDKINKNSNSKDNFKVVQDLLSQVISKSLNLSGMSISSHMPELVEKLDFVKLEVALKEKLKDGYKTIFQHLCEIWMEIQLKNKIQKGMNTDFTIEDFNKAEILNANQFKKLEESLMTATTRYIEADDLNTYLQSLSKASEIENNELKNKIEENNSTIEQMQGEIGEMKLDKKKREFEFDILAKENKKFLQVFKISYQKIYQMQDLVISARENLKPDKQETIGKLTSDTRNAYVKAFKDFFIHHIKLINTLSLNQEDLDIPDFDMIDEFEIPEDNSQIIKNNKNEVNENLKEILEENNENDSSSISDEPTTTKDPNDNKYTEKEKDLNILSKELSMDNNQKIEIHRKANVKLNQNMKNASMDENNKTESEVQNSSKKGRRRESYFIKEPVHQFKKINDQINKSDSKSREIILKKSRTKENQKETESIQDKKEKSFAAQTSEEGMSERMKLNSSDRTKSKIIDNKNDQNILNRSKSKLKENKKEVLFAKTKPVVKYLVSKHTDRSPVSFAKDKSSDLLVSDSAVKVNSTNKLIDPDENISDDLSLQSEHKDRKKSSKKKSNKSRHTNSNAKRPKDESTTIGIQTSLPEISNNFESTDKNQNILIQNAPNCITKEREYSSKYIQTSKFELSDQEISSTKPLILRKQTTEVHKAESQMKLKPDLNLNESTSGSTIKNAVIHKKSFKENILNKLNSQDGKVPRQPKIDNISENEISNEDKKTSLTEIDSLKLRIKSPHTKNKKVVFSKHEEINTVPVIKNEIEKETNSQSQINEILEMVKHLNNGLTFDLYNKLGEYITAMRLKTELNSEENSNYNIKLKGSKFENYNTSNVTNKEKKSKFSYAGDSKIPIDEFVLNISKGSVRINKNSHFHVQEEKGFEPIYHADKTHIEGLQPEFYLLPHGYKPEMNRENRSVLYRPGVKIRKRTKEFSMNLKKVEECFVTHRVAPHSFENEAHIPHNHLPSTVKEGNHSRNEHKFVKIMSRDDLSNEFRHRKSLVFDPDLKKIYNLIYFGNNAIEKSNFNIISTKRENNFTITQPENTHISSLNKFTNSPHNPKTEIENKIKEMCKKNLAFDDLNLLEDDYYMISKLAKAKTDLITQFADSHASCGQECPHILTFMTYLERYLTKLGKRNLMSLPVIKLDRPEVPRLSQFMGHLTNQ